MSKVNFRTTKAVVPIDSIRPNRWNPNVMEKFMFEKQKKSINELGFLGSILVREHEVNGYYEILDGEHRWKALKEAGAIECPIESIGKIEDKEAQLLTVLINNLHGKDDVFKRAKILKALDAGQLSLLPLTEQEIEHEKQFVDFDFSIYEVEDTVPERKNAKVVILEFNHDEAMVWNKAKEEYMKRGLISEKNTKKQDIQLVMRLLKNFLGIVCESGPGENTIHFEA